MAVADDSFAILEDALIAADVGVTTAADIVREAQTLTGGSPRDCLAAVLERRLLVLSASLKYGRVFALCHCCNGNKRRRQNNDYR